MIRRATTICGGLAVVVGLFLPVVPSAALTSLQTVPAAGPAPDAASKASYERVWLTALESGAPFAIAMVPGLVVLAADEAPLQARSLESGSVTWTSPATFNAAPIVRDGRLYGVGGGHLHAILADRGEPVWSVPFESTIPGREPVVTDDAVAVAGGEELRAYRATDGAALWRQSMGAAALSSPIAADTAFLVTLAGNQVAAFDRSTGARLWRTTLDSAPGPLTAAGDLAFFGTATSGICALDWRSGRLVWCFGTAPVPAVGPAIVDRTSVYFALRDNTLRAFDARSGTLRRLESLPARPTAGALRAGTQLAVPMTTGAVALLPLDGAQSKPTLAFDPPAGHVLKAAAASTDGTWIVTLTTELNERLSLTGYRRKTTAAPEP